MSSSFQLEPLCALISVTSPVNMQFGDASNLEIAEHYKDSENALRTSRIAQIPRLYEHYNGYLHHLHPFSLLNLLYTYMTS